MSDADVAEVESELGFKLPASYVSFMRAKGKALQNDSNSCNLYLSLGDLTMAPMLAAAAADSAVGELPPWWNDFFAIGDDGGGGFLLMKRDGSPEVWLMDSDWHEEPSVHSPTLQAYVAKSHKRD